MEKCLEVFIFPVPTMAFHTCLVAYRSIMSVEHLGFDLAMLVVDNVT